MSSEIEPYPCPESSGPTLAKIMADENQRLRDENRELREHIEQLNAHVGICRGIMETPKLNVKT